MDRLYVSFEDEDLPASLGRPGVPLSEHPKGRQKSPHF